MKLNQTDNQIQIKTGGSGQLISGIVGAAIGIAFAGFILTGPTNGTTGNKASPAISLVGLLFVVIGFFIARSAQNRTVTLVRGGTCTITARRLIGGNISNQTFEASDVVQVRLQTYISNTDNSSSSTNNSSISSNGSSQRRSELSLILKNNDAVQLADEGSKAGSFSFNGLDLSSLIQKAPLGKEAKQIADLLGVTVDAVDMTNPITAIKSAVGAFAEARQQATEPSVVAQPSSPPTSAPAAPTVVSPPAIPTPVIAPTNPVIGLPVVPGGIVGPDATIPAAESPAVSLPPQTPQA